MRSPPFLFHVLTHLLLLPIGLFVFVALDQPSDAVVALLVAAVLGSLYYGLLTLRTYVFTLLALLLVLALVNVEAGLVIFFVIYLSYFWTKRALFKKQFSFDYELTTTYAAALVVTMVLFWIPSVLTMSAPAYDGSAVTGFPFPYESHGGLCFDPESNGGVYCRSGPNILFFALDMLFLLGLPLLFNAIALAVRRHRAQKA